jgi:SAM-dependent methyltransferase
MKEFWNNRFSEAEYAYGTEPNAFIREQLLKLKPGKILFPAEGEGRNAVFAASLGWDVVAFDISEEGKRKALMLAVAKGVTIDYRLAGYEDFEDEAESYDAIGLVFAHTNPLKRASYHEGFTKLLKPGGHIILMGFSPEQLAFTSGGPKDYNMLYTRDMLEGDFHALTSREISELTVVHNEGLYHVGKAAIIRLFGTK